jgi:hypothetical protein
MMAYLTSGIPLIAFVALVVVIVSGGLIFYALRNKGDVFAELSHGKTVFRIDAKDRQRKP